MSVINNLSYWGNALCDGAADVFHSITKESGDTELSISRILMATGAMLAPYAVYKAAKWARERIQPTTPRFADAFRILEGAGLLTEENSNALLQNEENLGMLITGLSALAAAGLLTQENFDELIQPRLSPEVADAVRALNAAAGLLTQSNFRNKEDLGRLITGLSALAAAGLLTQENFDDLTHHMWDGGSLWMHCTPWQQPVC